MMELLKNLVCFLSMGVMAMSIIKTNGNIALAFAKSKFDNLSKDELALAVVTGALLITSIIGVVLCILYFISTRFISVLI